MESAVVYPRRFASLVKFEHTVFALPFAYAGVFLALDEVPSAAQVVWVTLAMVGALVAMAVNCLIDAGIDARNPRTAGRELPQERCVRGRSRSSARLARPCSRFDLDPIVRWLWPIPVAMFVVYPYLKRVTWPGHAWLGATLGPVRRRLGGDDGRAAARGLAARRCRRSLGGRLRPLLRDLRHRDRPRPGPAFVSGAFRRRRGVLGRARAARGHALAARLGGAELDAAASSTGWRALSRACSRTSMPSCRRATCDASTRRSSR